MTKVHMRKQRSRHRSHKVKRSESKELRKDTHKLDTPTDVLRFISDMWRNGAWKSGYVRLYRRNYTALDWKRITTGVQSLNARRLIEHYKIGKGGNVLSVKPKSEV